MPTAPRVVWSWSRALLGAVYAAPAAFVMLDDPEHGLGLMIGVLCAAGLGLRPLRRQRVVSVVAGVLAGIGMFLGSCVAPWPAVAVPSLFLLAVLVSVTSSRHRHGPLVLVLTLPLFAAGLSESGPSAGAIAGLLIVAGSVYAWLVSLAWPSRDEPRRGGPGPGSPDPRTELWYGVRLGLTGALAVGSGYLLGFDHPGWAATTALLVSRPDATLTRVRGVSRLVAVSTGALLAIVLAASDPSGAVLAASTGAAVAALAATAGSRWYITGGFTTFVVISLLTLQKPGESDWWFLERVAATAIGVGLAGLLMVALPALSAYAKRPRPDGRGLSEERQVSA